MADFVLEATITSKNLGRAICFQQLTGIGPMTSAIPENWLRFSSEESARKHPANHHPVAFFEAVPFDDALARASVADKEEA